MKKAWMTEDDRVISDAQKQRALLDGGACASSVEPHSILLVEIADMSPAKVEEIWQSLAWNNLDPMHPNFARDLRYRFAIAILRAARGEQ